jgi:hypothetical protein
VRRDRDYLYLAFDVRDARRASRRRASRSNRTASPSSSTRAPIPRARTTTVSWAAIGDGTLASLLVTTLTAVEPLPDPSIDWMIAPPPKGLRRAVRARPDGYRAELAVPCSFLDERAGGAWERFRLNVVLHDYGPDGAGAATSGAVALGLPSATIRGAGTFVRWSRAGEAKFAQRQPTSWTSSRPVHCNTRSSSHTRLHAKPSSSCAGSPARSKSATPRRARARRTARGRDSRAHFGIADRAVQLGELRPAPLEQQQMMAIARRRDPEQRWSATWVGVVAARSRPRTTRETPSAASSTTPAR